MPHENEIKYVVSSYEELETLLTPFGWQDIEQGYLTVSNRVRRITYDTGVQQHFFTYKQRIRQGRTLEIEPVISAADFAEAWEYTIERLVKRRIAIEHDDLKWDIDFYRWHHGKYFVLAEVEMPPYMERPKAILPDLVPHMIFEVPRDDDRFAARWLANEDHVRKVAQALGLL